MQLLTDLLTKLGFGGTFVSGAVFATAVILFIYRYPEKFEKYLKRISLDKFSINDKKEFYNIFGPTKNIEKEYLKFLNDL